MNSVVSGKIKEIRYYPKEEISNHQNWIASIQEKIKIRPKY
jgi:hypothetical protein